MVLKDALNVEKGYYKKKARPRPVFHSEEEAQ
jgi:hypothetical protein